MGFDVAADLRVVFAAFYYSRGDGRVPDTDFRPYPEPPALSHRQGKLQFGVVSEAGTQCDPGHGRFPSHGASEVILEARGAMPASKNGTELPAGNMSHLTTCSFRLPFSEMR